MAKKKNEPETIDDPVFGTLAWDALEGAWQAGIEVEYFRDFGRDLPAFPDDEEDEDDEDEDPDVDADEPIAKAISSSTGFMDLMMQTAEVQEGLAELPADQRAMLEQAFGSLREQAEAADNPPVNVNEVLDEGKFVLSVVPDEKKKPPTDAHRKAWAALMGDAEGVFGKVMGKALETYRRQRPARLRWWKALDADAPATHLPDVKTATALAKIVRPMQFKVYPGGEIGISFDGSWDRGEAFGVVLRDGQVIAFGPEKVAVEYTGKRERARTIDHPVFGELALATSDEWVGVLRFEPFESFYEIANERRSRSMFGDQLPPWSPPWDFVEGEFGLTVFAPKDGQEPSQAQVEAFQAFMADPQKVADDVVAAVYKYYRDVHADYEDEDEEDDDAPRVKSPADLRELMTFQSLWVTPPRKKKSAGVVLNFSCSWDEEHGMSVLWRDGKVREVDQACQVDA